MTIDDLVTTPKPWQVSLRYARDRVKSDPALAPWDGDLTAFRGALDKSRREQKSERDAYLGDKATEPYVGGLNRATMLVNELEAVLGRVLDTASFLRLQQSFRIARLVIVAWLLAAAGGVLIFVYAARTALETDVAATPVTASLRVPADDRTFVTHRLGVGCGYDLDSVPVVVLGKDAQTGIAEVVTVPTATCSPVRLKVPGERLAGPPPQIAGR
jgi:hypothetical protein